MANDMQALMESIRNIARRPAQAKMIADAALRNIQAVGQQMSAISAANASSAAAHDAAVLAAAKGTPREKALAEIGRLLFLEMLDDHIKLLKEHATGTFQRAGLGTIGPSNWVLGRVRQVQTAAREIEANLRRLAAIDGIDSAIYSTLVAHISHVGYASLDAALAQDITRSDFKQDIGPFLVYVENRVVRTILEKTASKYSRSISFDLSRALMDLVAALVLNNMNSMSRVREMTELYRREQNGKVIKEYYQALFAQIKGAA